MERVDRIHADGVYVWRQAEWGETDTQHPTTHGAKVGRRRRMGSVSGFFSPTSDRGVGGLS